MAPESEERLPRMPIVEAVRDFAKQNGLTSLPDGLNDLIGTVAAEDYDAMYNAVGEIIAFFPPELHSKLYDVVRDAVPDELPDAEDAADDIDAAAKEGINAEYAGQRSGVNDDGDFSMTDAIIDRIGRVEQNNHQGLQIELGDGLEEAAGSDLEERKDMFEADWEDFLEGDLPERIAKEAAPDTSEQAQLKCRLRSAAAKYNRHGLLRAWELNCSEAEALKLACKGLEGHLRTLQEHASNISRANAKLTALTQLETVAQPPAWTSMLTEETGYASGSSCEESLLSIAGAFRFPHKMRRIGTPYFATPPAGHDRNARHGETPPENSDVGRYKQAGQPGRAVLAAAYRTGGMVRAWRTRERKALRDAVALAAAWWEGGNGGGEEGGSETRNGREKMRDVVLRWDLSDWEMLVRQNGSRFGRREAADIMCRFVNVEAPWLERVGEMWSAEEDERLDVVYKEVMEDKGRTDGWIGVAEGMGGKRSVTEVVRRWQGQKDEMMRKERKSAMWTAEEDRRLRVATELLGEGNWMRIALVVGDGVRNGQQCMHRWIKRVGGMRRAGPWEKEEVDRLRKAVGNVGTKWIEVARLVASRTDVQCREKWVNTMDPDIRRGAWTEAEDGRLREVVQREGVGRWARVAEAVGGRTDAQCQRRWNRLQNRKRARIQP